MKYQKVVYVQIGMPLHEFEELTAGVLPFHRNTHRVYRGPVDRWLFALGQEVAEHPGNPEISSVGKPHPGERLEERRIAGRRRVVEDILWRHAADETARIAQIESVGIELQHNCTRSLVVSVRQRIDQKLPQGEGQVARKLRVHQPPGNCHDGVIRRYQFPQPPERDWETLDSILSRNTPSARSKSGSGSRIRSGDAPASAMRRRNSSIPAGLSRSGVLPGMGEALSSIPASRLMASISGSVIPRKPSPRRIRYLPSRV